MTKVDIFSGFLGAGKTTLIKKLIKECYKDEKIVLIENEFGEIGIDGHFMKDAGIEITEMNSGCICCSLVGDFGEALKKVVSEYNPDRILIEPSGVGKLSDVIKAVKNAGEEALELNSFCTVADVKKCKMYMKNFGEFYNDQIENALCIVLSRTQDASEEKVEESVKLLREYNPEAVIITTPWEALSGDVLLSAMEGRNSLKTALENLEKEEMCPVCGHHHHHDEHHHDEHCHDEHHHGEHHHDGHCHGENHHDEHCHGEHCHGEHHHHHHHADDVFESFGKETTASYTEEEIRSALASFDTGKYGTVLRAKGMVKGDKGFILFDYVPGSVDVRYGKEDVIGRVCVIGSKLDKKAISELFRFI